MSGACNWEKCMLNSDVHIIIDGRMTTFMNSIILTLAHVKSSLVCSVMASRLYSCFDCRQTSFVGFVQSAEISFHTCLVLLLTPVI